jgi:hypothetical protein
VGQNSDIQTGNKSFERVERLKCLVATLTNRSSIHEEIKSRLKSGNACCHSVQNLLSSSLLSKSVKIWLYRSIILPVVLYECETWSLTLREEWG